MLHHVCSHQAVDDVRTDSTPSLSPYKILFHFKALLWESILLLLPAPLAKPTLLQYYCTPIQQYTPLPG